MADPLVAAAMRVYAEFADRTTLAEVRAVVARGRNDLDTPSVARAAGDGRAAGPATASPPPAPATARIRW